MVRVVKTNSSKRNHEAFDANVWWQDGYGAFTVGQSSLADVKAYIAGQEEHHKEISFQDELREFLIKHNVKFDEKYLV